MDLAPLKRRSDVEWLLEPRGLMRVPAVIYGTESLLRDMDETVLTQIGNVASLPGIVGAAYAMPDAHWGYGFPIGGVAAFDPDEGGVVSAGGVGFDVSCGVRSLLTGIDAKTLAAKKEALADVLYESIPAGLGSKGRIALDAASMDAMLMGGAKWAVENGWGEPDDLMRIEERGVAEKADPSAVSEKAKTRQRHEMGTLGSGNHYLEVQEIEKIHDAPTAEAFGLVKGEVVISIHCGSRGLGHQIGTDYLREMAIEAPQHGIHLPDRELACAPIRSALGMRYLSAMRAAINCALANRQIITALVRKAVAHLFPDAHLKLLFDVSHNTCKVEEHRVPWGRRALYVHRKGATRAFGPGHPDLPETLRPFGQPVLIGGSMGTASYILTGMAEAEAKSFASACHGAGRSMSRHQATKAWNGRTIVEQLAARGILIRSPSMRGVAEEAPGAYKDVGEVVDAAEAAELARKVARLAPLICVKG